MFNVISPVFSFEVFLCIAEELSESGETIESVVVAIDPNSGLTSPPAINEDRDDCGEDCDDDDDDDVDVECDVDDDDVDE